MTEAALIAYPERCAQFLNLLEGRVGPHRYREMVARVSYGDVLTPAHTAERLLRSQHLWFSALYDWQRNEWKNSAGHFKGWRGWEVLHSDDSLESLRDQYLRIVALSTQAHPPGIQQLGQDVAMHWPLAQHSRIRGILRGGLNP